ncbi:flavin-containing monooxygenase [Nonomuraea sp. AD125B]|uniref:flavin-containing monooxygenase n=1 Tax=Nonomuraea sp. AD125B TaxID=3242897 RepID=UPI0035294ECA
MPIGNHEHTPAVAIIGAGIGGLAAAKALDDAGVTWECFDRRPDVGGLWSQDPEREDGPAYRALHVNSSAKFMAMSGLPIPPDYPEFPSREQIGRYLVRYAEHFGLSSRVRLRTEVTSLKREPSGGWTVETSDGERRRYASVVVAAGHFSQPVMPRIPDFFAGEVLHAHDYVSPERFAGRNVLVVGLGASGADIACEVSRTAARTAVSVRGGVHIVPKHLFGRPFDTFPVRTRPRWLRWKVMRLAVRLSRGPQERYGITAPDRPLGNAAVTVTSDLLTRLSHGDLAVRPALKGFKEDAVVFADGSVEPYDTVILCTGYRPSFPFLDPAIAPPRDGLDLFRRVFHPAATDLAFVGLVQVLGAAPATLERQARLVAARLSGRYALPGEHEIARQLIRDRARAERMFGADRRAGMLLDPVAYRSVVENELRAGRRRARRGIVKAASPAQDRSRTGSVAGSRRITSGLRAAHRAERRL